MQKDRKVVVEVVRVDRSDTARIVGRSLKALREVAGLTQIDMADRLKVGQAAISKIERRGDVQISSLQRYVEALGATLRIEATFRSDSPLRSQLEGAFDLDIPDENQLSFPIFGDDPFRPHRDVVLSIRPRYSEKILRGAKTVELRRRFPVSAPPGTIAYIYSTSPVRAMVGFADIVDVEKLPIDDIWKRYSESASVEKPDFESYFGGLHEGFVLKFANAKPLSRHLQLAELRERFGFEPPQSFLYASPALRAALRHEYANLSD